LLFGASKAKIKIKFNGGGQECPPYTVGGRARATAMRVSERALRGLWRASISDAIKDLGKPEEISKAFVGFQKYLYQPVPSM
jgi:hypothetical protein